MSPEIRPVEVVVRLRADVSEAARGGEAGAEAGAAADRIGETVRRRGGRLTPQHPGADDPTLKHYFVIEATPANAAQELATELLGLDGVEAAYVKPQPAMP